MEFCNSFDSILKGQNEVTLNLWPTAHFKKHSDKSQNCFHALPIISCQRKWKDWEAVWFLKKNLFLIHIKINSLKIWPQKVASQQETKAWINISLRIISISNMQSLFVVCHLTCSMRKEGLAILSSTEANGAH